MARKINKPGTGSDLSGIIERMRGHALWYMHEQGPDSPVGMWLWTVAEKMEKSG